MESWHNYALDLARVLAIAGLFIAAGALGELLHVPPIVSSVLIIYSWLLFSVLKRERKR